MATGDQSAEILRAVTALWEPGAVYELRVLLKGRKGAVASGYFDDPARLAAAAAQYNGRAKSVSMTLNPVTPALLARAANRVIEQPEQTTGDQHITRRRWLPIDIDPERPSGISATEEEHQQALGQAKAVSRWLAEHGVPKESIIAADSGNGAHLLIRVDLPNDDESRELLKRILQAVSCECGNDRGVIDTSIDNAARVWKVYGTRAMKGDSTAERPHRVSRLLYVPPSPAVVSLEVLHGLADMAPPPEPPRRYSDAGRTEFSVAGFVQRHLSGMVQAIGAFQGGTKWKLRECPFDASHRNTAVVIEFPSGAGAFRCLKASCQHHDWRDLRTMFEPIPDPRPRSAGPPPEPPIEYYGSFPEAQRKAGRQTAPEKPRPEGGPPSEMTGTELLQLELGELQWVVDSLLPDGLTLLVGRAKQGKSLLMMGLCLAIVSGGKALGSIDVAKGRVLYVALEDGWRRLRRRLLKIAAGAGADLDQLHFTTKWPRLDAGGLEVLDAWLEEHPETRLVVLDTLQRIRPLQTGRNAYAEDYGAVEGLQQLAERRRVAIVLVHHTNKREAEDWLDEISGTTGLSGGVDGILLLRRRRGEDDATLCIEQRDGEEGTLEWALEFDGSTATWHLNGDAEEERMRKERAAVINALAGSVDAMSPTELAEVLDEPVGAIKMRLKRMLSDGQVILLGRGRYSVPTNDRDVVANAPRFMPYRDNDDEAVFS